MTAEILRHLYPCISTFLMKVTCCRNIEIVLCPTTFSNIYCVVVYKLLLLFIYIYMYMLPLFVNLKKVYDRNVVNKYGLYLLLGVVIYNLIDYMYIYIYTYGEQNIVWS